MGRLLSSRSHSVWYSGRQWWAERRVKLPSTPPLLDDHASPSALSQWDSRSAGREDREASALSAGRSSSSGGDNGDSWEAT